MNNTISAGAGGGGVIHQNNKWSVAPIRDCFFIKKSIKIIACQFFSWFLLRPSSKLKVKAVTENYYSRLFLFKKKCNSILPH